MATRIRLNDLERRILDRVLLSGDGYEEVEQMLAALGADRGQFVDALENLEGEGCVSVSSLGGSIVVTCGDPLTGHFPVAQRPALMCADRVGHC